MSSHYTLYFILCQILHLEITYGITCNYQDKGKQKKKKILTDLKKSTSEAGN